MLINIIKWIPCTLGLFLFFIGVLATFSDTVKEKLHLEIDEDLITFAVVCGFFMFFIGGFIATGGCV